MVIIYKRLVGKTLFVEEECGFERHAENSLNRLYVEIVRSVESRVVIFRRSGIHCGYGNGLHARLSDGGGVGSAEENALIRQVETGLLCGLFNERARARVVLNGAREVARIDGGEVVVAYCVKPDKNRLDVAQLIFMSLAKRPPPPSR